MSDCIGCTQAVIASEAAYQSTLKNAITHVERTKIAVKVFKELGNWTFIPLTEPGALNTPGRTVVSWSEGLTAVQVH